MEFTLKFKEYDLGPGLVSTYEAAQLIFQCFKQQPKQLYQYLVMLNTLVWVQACRRKHVAGVVTEHPRYPVSLGQDKEQKVRNTGGPCPLIPTRKYHLLSTFFHFIIQNLSFSYVNLIILVSSTPSKRF